MKRSQLVAVFLSLFFGLYSQETVIPCDSAVYCYSELLSLVQTLGVFNDSKTFVDMPMVMDPDEVLWAFSNWTNRTREGLLEFVELWFDPVGSDINDWIPTDWQERPKFIETIQNNEYQEWAMELNKLWKDFGKQVSDSVHEFPSQHSLLPVEYPFIAPGGRFTEFYYWDSYWIIRGLLLCGMNNTVKGMIRNLAKLVDTYGLVPNGGRVYYTKRSQPPLLPLMVSVYYNTTNDVSFLNEVLPYLDKEYIFWMKNRSVLFSECNCTLNQYSSPVTTPRPESYREDFTTARDIPIDEQSELYSNIASGAESGWDFSSRWFSSSGTLASIRIKSVIPVDLNSILGINEMLLHQLHTAAGTTLTAAKYAEAWNNRKRNFTNVFWNEDLYMWTDRILEDGSYLQGFYASSLTPLYMWKIDNNLNITRSKLVLQKLNSLGVLDYPGGIPTSLNKTSAQQWDFPNAWSPLQWFIVQAWKDSGDSSLEDAASMVATTWLRSTYKGWLNYNNSMFEKYDSTEAGQPGGGGEYEVQSGFGWTNAIVLDFLETYQNSTPSSSLSSSSPLPNYVWVLLSILILFVCTLCISIPCILWCNWLYKDGKRRYWSRVRNEQLLQSSISSAGSDAQSPTVFENPHASEWPEADTSYCRINM